MKFSDWLKNKKLSEMAGTFGIVGCKDINNPNFQIWGAMSDLGCSKKRKRKLKIKESVQIKLSDLADIKTKFENADFWIVRRGSLSEVGKPTKKYNPEHIGLKVTSDQILPDYLFYSMMHIHNNGYFSRLATGTTNLVNIRISDVSEIRLG
jgi:hypothetical protein